MGFGIFLGIEHGVPWNSKDSQLKMVFRYSLGKLFMGGNSCLEQLMFLLFVRLYVFHELFMVLRIFSALDWALLHLMQDCIKS
jgi:hypothetical protein